jgi:hypothetical protein
MKVVLDHAAPEVWMKPLSEVDDDHEKVMNSERMILLMPVLLPCHDRDTDQISIGS